MDVGYKRRIRGKSRIHFAIARRLRQMQGDFGDPDVGRGGSDRKKASDKQKTGTVHDGCLRLGGGVTPTSPPQRDFRPQLTATPM
jgi:hypothetical protein